MIWSVLCFLGYHDWRPVFRHHVAPSGTLTSLVRCQRRSLSGKLCGAERYQHSTPTEWKRGGQVK